MRNFLHSVEREALNGSGIGFDDAILVLEIPREWVFDLFGVTERVKKKYIGDRVRLCSIVNAKSGMCSEDCSFCSQSRVSRSKVERYPLLEAREIIERAKDAKEAGAKEFSIVTSGQGLRKREEIKEIGAAIEAISGKLGLETCVSVGIVPRETIEYFKARGLTSFHHNLETSRTFFPSVCTTHDYEEDVETVREAKKAGLWVCCGGIFGLGESNCDRVELAMTLRELDVDAIPLNFLNPIPGTPVEGKNELDPFTCLKIIAMMRLVHPTKDIIVCGGREVNLRDLQCLIFPAGASGTMLGNYLTTRGRPQEDDIRMMEDLGLDWKRDGFHGS
jgi:biotin synthase